MLSLLAQSTLPLKRAGGGAPGGAQAVQISAFRLPSLPQDAPTVVVEDLRLCTVKPCEDLERRFCFEVVSPTK